MKNIVCAVFLLFTGIIFAQKPCEIETNVADSLGTYKATKQYLVFERSFAGNSSDIFFSLTNTNGILAINAQILQHSSEFIAASCFDKTSKIFFQLNNSKIITAYYSGNDTCGSLIRDDKSQNNRILSGTFLLVKENYEELKNSPVTFMRVKYANETIDYPFKSEISSELTKNKYQPETYFMDYLKCIEN